MEQIRSLLLALQPGTGQGLAGLQPGPPSSHFEGDVLSLAASANLFDEAMTEGDASHTLDEASCSSAQGSRQGAADTSMAAVLRTALARLQLDAAQTDIRRDRLAEILERRGKEYKKHHARNASPLVPGALDSDEKGDKLEFEYTPLSSIQLSTAVSHSGFHSSPHGPHSHSRYH
ncbi:unnamed protein product [Gadus morhua 'NCC']